SYGDAIGWYGAGPLALEQTGWLALSDPSTKGAIHTSLGYSPRNCDIGTVQGLKARSIGSGNPERARCANGASAYRPTA
ncbi:MAG: hypothetical protein NTX27_17630, partial [Verrucomicrobia bacterium]|nr:hypothetical protein [Verrucomicrobiota bacterium]